MEPIEVLQGVHRGETLLVIGSGPSLARLGVRHIGEGPVIAINTAILTVEELSLPNVLYSMQKDMEYARTAAPILAHAHESAKGRDFGDYVFDNERLGLPWNAPSVVSAYALGVFMGCQQVNYLCCDAAVSGDLRRFVGGELAEANRPADYLHHRGLVEREAAQRGVPVLWWIPE